MIDKLMDPAIGGMFVSYLAIAVILGIMWLARKANGDKP